MTTRELCCLSVAVGLVVGLVVGFLGCREYDELFTVKHDWRDIARLDSKIADLNVRINDMEDARCKCKVITPP